MLSWLNQKAHAGQAIASMASFCVTVILSFVT